VTGCGCEHRAQLLAGVFRRVAEGFDTHKTRTLAQLLVLGGLVLAAAGYGGWMLAARFGGGDLVRSM
jgi:hypothetical protein